MCGSVWRVSLPRFVSKSVQLHWEKKNSKAEENVNSCTFPWSTLKCILGLARCDKQLVRLILYSGAFKALQKKRMQHGDATKWAPQKMNNKMKRNGIYVCLLYQIEEGHSLLITPHNSNVVCHHFCRGFSWVRCPVYVMIYSVSLFPLKLFTNFSTKAKRTNLCFYRFCFSNIWPSYF